MPKILPSSELRNKYNEISRYCHEYSEPVYITKNGQGDLAVMSIETYEKIAGKFELENLLSVGIDEYNNNKISDADSVFDKIEKKIRK
ncbi:MAG: type II toxin-antitoxin system prevent-host-death family antitoxin [Candidatus Muiribacteriota bacterium]